MIGKRLLDILFRIQKVTQLKNIQQKVKLVAISKTKSFQEIKEAYDAGQRHFGQNYVDQIEQKHSKVILSSNIISKLPNDIKWHFVGHLQSNKIKKVLVPNLYIIETVDRKSLAEKLQKHIQKQNKQLILNILIQVKTSEQQSKNGCPVQQIQEIYEYITNQCPNLKFKGLMTIGKQGDMSVFSTMYSLKRKMCQKYKILQNQFQLSMGMSADFQAAIQNHSTSVRVGSSIFGERNYPNKQKIQQTKV